jgi:hypothetical protein
MSKPKCAVCSKQLSKYGAKYCKKHRPISLETRNKLSQNMVGNTHAKGKNLNNTHGFKKGKPSWNKGKLHKAITGSNNYQWKGNKASYRSIHRWVAYWKGTPKKCEHCGENNPNKRYHWANISGQYKRDLNDYIRLCVPCHKYYDQDTKNNC